MKIVTIIPAAKKPEKVSQGDWDAITKAGPIENIPFGTAVANIRNSKGAYMLKPEAVPVQIMGGAMQTIDDMSAEQLKLLVMSSGKTIRKANMKMSDLRAMAREAVESTITIIPEDDDAVIATK